MLMLNIKMPISEAIAVSLIGITTVMIILAVIAMLIILVSKVIRSVEASFSSKKAEPSVQSAAVAASATVEEPEVELIDTDEKSAAVIMAIVSQKSGIPVERLRFKSIKYIGEDGKGENR